MPNTPNIAAILHSLIAAGDVLAVHHDGRFLEATLTAMDDGHFHFRSGEGLSGECTFSMRHYQFAVGDVTPCGGGSYRASWPRRITQVHKRHFLRRRQKSDQPLRLELAHAGQALSLPIINLSLSGMAVRLPENPEIAPGTIFPAASIAAGEQEIRLTVAFAQRHSPPDSGGFHIVDIAVLDFQALQRLLSSQTVWEDSDFTMYL